MLNTISYGIEDETGIVVSRVGHEAAYPVLDFEAIGQGGDGYAPGDFRGPARYSLEKMSAYEIGYEAANRPSWLGVPLRGLAALTEQLMPTWPTKTEA